MSWRFLLKTSRPGGELPGTTLQPKKCRRSIACSSIASLMQMDCTEEDVTAWFLFRGERTRKCQPARLDRSSPGRTGGWLAAPHAGAAIDGQCNPGDEVCLLRRQE